MPRAERRKAQNKSQTWQNNNLHIDGPDIALSSDESFGKSKTGICRLILPHADHNVCDGTRRLHDAFPKPHAFTIPHPMKGKNRELLISYL